MFFLIRLLCVWLAVCVFGVQNFTHRSCFCFFLAFVLHLVSFKGTPAWLCTAPHIGFYVVTFQCNKKWKFNPLRHLPVHLNPSNPHIAAGIYIRISLNLPSALSFTEHYSEDQLPGMYFVKFWSRFLKFFSCFHCGEKVENANRQPFYSLIQHPTQATQWTALSPFFFFFFFFGMRCIFCTDSQRAFVAQLASCQEEDAVCFPSPSLMLSTLPSGRTSESLRV